MEWAILQHSKKSGPFSRPGDSGSCMADGQGRLGGVVTSGAGGGGVGGIDVTYASSINSIMADVWAKFPGAHLSPQFHSA